MIRIERLIFSVLIIIATVFAGLNWRRAAFLSAENDQLRVRIAEFEEAAENSARLMELARSQAEKFRGQTSELMQLRNEVTQLRKTSKDLDPLVTENQRLKLEIVELRMAAGAAQAAQNVGADAETGHDHFPRDSWAFAGYSSPEAALVSAIWAMKEGDPQSYLDSLAPDEQERMAQIWQTKSETEIAEKHKSDVASIAGMRVLERQNVSPTEVVMNVLLEGPDRVERIRMNQVGQEWKFGGFIREQQPVP